MSVWIPALLCVVLAAPATQNPPTSAEPDSAETTPQKSADPLDAKPPTPVHTGFRALVGELEGDVSHLPSTQNFYLAAIGGGLALGTHPFDHTVNVRELNEYAIVNTLFSPAKYYGDTPEQLALSIGTWVLGRVLDKPKLAHLGMDLLRAQAVTELMVEPLKLATRRERPDLSDRQSFPSGHAAITFAAAAVIERHLGWKHSVWAYGIASYVAASRLHDNKHYLSDVVFGAAVGSIAGRTVTRHGRDAWTVGPTAVPGGIAIVATRAASGP